MNWKFWKKPQARPISYGAEQWTPDSINLSNVGSHFIGTFLCQCDFVFQFKCSHSTNGLGRGATTSYMGPGSCRSCSSSNLALIRVEDLNGIEVEFLISACH
jgi:hypothetical protein